MMHSETCWVCGDKEGQHELGLERMGEGRWDPRD